MQFRNNFIVAIKKKVRARSEISHTENNENQENFSESRIDIKRVG